MLDHRVTLASGQAVEVPMRILAEDGGSRVNLTVSRQPGMDDAEFEHDVALVKADLERLAALLDGA